MTHLLYLDPGSGSVLLQALIAGFVGVSIFFKNIKNYVLHVFRKSKNIQETPSTSLEEITAVPEEK